MVTRLGGRTAFVIAVLVLFCYGIVGIPHGSLKQSISKRINLGLDLKGGVHLVLAVQMSEAHRGRHRSGCCKPRISAAGFRNHRSDGRQSRLVAPGDNIRYRSSDNKDGRGEKSAGEGLNTRPTMLRPSKMEPTS